MYSMFKDCDNMSDCGFKNDNALFNFLLMLALVHFLMGFYQDCLLPNIALWNFFIITYCVSKVLRLED